MPTPSPPTTMTITATTTTTTTTTTPTSTSTQRLPTPMPTPTPPSPSPTVSTPATSFCATRSETQMTLLGNGCCRVDYREFLIGVEDGTQSECKQSCIADDNCIAVDMMQYTVSEDFVGYRYSCTKYKGSGSGLHLQCLNDSQEDMC